MNQDSNNTRRNPESKGGGYNFVLYAILFGIVCMLVVAYIINVSTEEIAYKDLIKLIRASAVSTEDSTNDAKRQTGFQ